ncbi:MAG: BadF/BadG/BcrA/BcrD ATPase family protein [Oryzihumus sp.]
MTVVLGVDVGGSGMRVAWANGSARGATVLADGAHIGEGGIDVPALLPVLSSYAAQLTSPPDVVVWSMRGLTTLAEPGEVLKHVASAVAARRVVVTSDAVASLVGALGEVRPGAVLAAGTGAVMLATDFDAVWHRGDGWGHVLGDRGSGAWIGLQGLQAALRHRDGLDDGSADLLETVTDLWGDPYTWPRAVMTGRSAPAELAALAPVVGALAPTDPAAAAICREAGHELARTLAAGAAAVRGATLFAVGGLLELPAVRAAFDDAVGLLGLDLAPALGTALDGALALGRHVGEGRALAAHPPYLLLS